jgi:hypothetical protein
MGGFGVEGTKLLELFTYILDWWKSRRFFRWAWLEYFLLFRGE